MKNSRVLEQEESRLEQLILIWRGALGRRAIDWHQAFSWVG